MSTGLKLHPIQTRNIGVRELYIKAKIPTSHDLGEKGGTFSMKVSHSEYDHENKVIIVVARVEVGRDDDSEKSPFEMTIEIAGEFEVDESKFPVDQINDWAKRNAPLILMPFLREHAYALTARCGFSPMLLPLFEVPTFKIEKKAEHS